MYLLSPLPDGSFAQLVELISPHCPLSEPYWVPSWWHLDPAAKAALDAAVDAVPAVAGPPTWAVAGHFLCEQRLRIRRVAERPCFTNEWAELFGLPPA
jgi:hypothetical protein